jgi:hypothetical protein
MNSESHLPSRFIGKVLVYNCRDENHMRNIGPGIQFFAEKMREKEFANHCRCANTGPTVGRNLRNCSVAALWNERDTACI